MSFFSVVSSRRMARMVCAALCGGLMVSVAACSRQLNDTPTASTSTPGTSAFVVSTSSNEAVSSASTSSAPSDAVQRKAYVEIHSAAEWNSFAEAYNADRSVFAEDVTVVVAAPLDFSDGVFVPLAYAGGVNLMAMTTPSADESPDGHTPGFYHIPADIGSEITVDEASRPAAADSYRCANLVFEDCLSPIALRLPDGDITIENIIARCSVQRRGYALPTGEPDAFRSYTLCNLVIDGELTTSDDREAVLAYCDSLGGNLLRDEMPQFVGSLRAGSGLLISDGIYALQPGSRLTISNVQIRNAGVCLAVGTDLDTLPYQSAGLLCGDLDAADGSVSISNVVIENCFGYGLSVSAVFSNLLFRDVLSCDRLTVRNCDLTSPYILQERVQDDWSGLVLSLGESGVRELSQSSDLLVRQFAESSMNRWNLQQVIFEGCRICVPELPEGQLTTVWNRISIDQCENVRYPR